jgi:predicted site-specific integrase-resolvase
LRRFGFELLEFICKKIVRRIVVPKEANNNKQDAAHELSEDLLSIVTVFVARNNRSRAGRNRKRRRELVGNQENQGTSREMQQDQVQLQ